MLNIEEVIRHRRKELGLSQSQLAHEANVSLPTIQNIETGKANLSQTTLEQILAALNLKLQVVPQPVLWDEAVRIGVPLSGANKVQVQSSKDFIHALDDVLRPLSQSKGDMIKDARNWEALTGFLWALQDHYPGIFRKLTYYKKAKWIVEKNQKVFALGRLIKLRRIALANISEVL
jgi:transcriptional regulator with XRE-family HTH domain